jgi:hypothetical protein
MAVVVVHLALVFVCTWFVVAHILNWIRGLP